MKRVAIVVLLTLACTSYVKVVMPYCPVSDSAWKKADSVPAICVLDTISQKRKHP